MSTETNFSGDETMLSLTQREWTLLAGILAWFLVNSENFTEEEEILANRIIQAA